MRRKLRTPRASLWLRPRRQLARGHLSASKVHSSGEGSPGPRGPAPACAQHSRMCPAKAPKQPPHNQCLHPCSSRPRRLGAS